MTRFVKAMFTGIVALPVLMLLAIPAQARDNDNNRFDRRGPDRNDHRWDHADRGRDNRHYAYNRYNNRPYYPQQHSRVVVIQQHPYDYPVYYSNGSTVIYQAGRPAPSQSYYYYTYR